MNTKSTIIRRVSAAFVVGLTLTAAVHAATATDHGKDAQGANAQVQQTCKDTVKYIMDGNNKTGLHPVTVRECTPPRKVEYWAGPRNTVPIYAER